MKDFCFIVDENSDVYISGTNKAIKAELLVLDLIEGAIIFDSNCSGNVTFITADTIHVNCGKTHGYPEYVNRDIKISEILTVNKV